MKNKKVNLKNLQTIFVVILAILVIYNQIQLFAISNVGGPISTSTSNVVANVIPTGVPKIYGSELGIKYDDVSPNNRVLADKTIAVMGNLDRTLTLTGDDLTRYIRITSQISCEYCCGAKSIIFSDGRPACGCAHSYAMRGLAKYLILNHGDELSDDEILSELAKWKTLYFPGQMTAKAQILSEKGIDVNYINLGSNKYRGIEKGVAGAGMVGGC